MAQSARGALDSLEHAARQVALGDACAFEPIVAATSAGLVRLSARIVGNMADAEDVVQESYVKAFAALAEGQFDGRSSVKTWLYRIVTRASIDALRRSDRRERLADAAMASEWGGAEVADARLALAELADWLQALPGEQRATLVLKAVEGLSTPEIAEIMQCSEGAVEQRLVRARNALREKRGTS